MGQRLTSRRQPGGWPGSRPPCCSPFVAEITAITPECGPTSTLGGLPRRSRARGSDAPYGRKPCPNTRAVLAPSAASLPPCSCSHRPINVVSARCPRADHVRDHKED